MNATKFAHLVAAGLIVAAITETAEAQLKLPRPSQKASVKQTVGFTDIEIVYSRPGVKGRVIWGDLVPFDEVWRTGANEATTISFSTEVMVNGSKVDAGKYSLHTIPSKSSDWTVIFNKDDGQWGSYAYDAAKDALRIKVMPEGAAMQEWMQFSFPVVTVDSAEVEMRWEKLRLSFTVAADVMGMTKKNIDEAMAGSDKWTADDWRVPYSAANWALDTGAYPAATVMQWLDRSIQLRETHWNVMRKARELAKQGKHSAAVPLGEKALVLGRAADSGVPPAVLTSAEKEIASWKPAGK